MVPHMNVFSIRKLNELNDLLTVHHVVRVYQYSENVMHFLFSILRIKGLYMFRTLLDHPQEALQNGTWYIACA
jgi:hypothetical protein